jgi:hypothetical protein
MLKALISIPFIIISLGMITSCESGKTIKPCDYTEEKFNMTILDVQEDPEHEYMYTVLVDFDGNISYADKTHNLTEIRNVKTDYDFITNNHITVGRVYTGTVHIKVEGSGDCENEIVDWDQKLIK